MIFETSLNFGLNIFTTLTTLYVIRGNCSTAPCDLQPSIDKGPSYYRRLTPWGKWLEMPCPPKTVFVAKWCRCDYPEMEGTCVTLFFELLDFSVMSRIIYFCNGWYSFFLFLFFSLCTCSYREAYNLCYVFF